MAKRRLSLLTTDLRNCYICGKPYAEVHHIMFGTGYRPLSEKYGLIVPLCYEHHQGDFGVHGKNGKELNLKLKVKAQETFEPLYGHDEWMRIFGRNYL